MTEFPTPQDEADLAASFETDARFASDAEEHEHDLQVAANDTLPEFGVGTTAAEFCVAHTGPRGLAGFDGEWDAEACEITLDRHFAILPPYSDGGWSLQDRQEELSSWICDWMQEALEQKDQGDDEWGALEFGAWMLGNFEAITETHPSLWSADDFELAASLVRALAFVGSNPQALAS